MIDLELTLKSRALIDCHQKWLIWMIKHVEKLSQDKGKHGLQDKRSKAFEVSWIAIF
jgi:hypothetical protein